MCLVFLNLGILKEEFFNSGHFSYCQSNVHLICSDYKTAVHKMGSHAPQNRKILQ